MRVNNPSGRRALQLANTYGSRSPEQSCPWVQFFQPNLTNQTTDPTHPTTQQKSIQPTTNLRHKEDNFMHIIHRNIMTVSKTPVNKHDIVSNIPYSMKVYQVSLASVNFWKFFRPMTQRNPPKS